MPQNEHPLVYLDSADAVARFLQEIGEVRELAIDTEGASFHRFVDRIYLLQLTTRDRSAIIDPLPIGAPEALGRMLEDPAVEVVFHDADYDLRLLHQDYGWHPTNIFDTRIAAQLLGLKSFGLAALLDRYFGVKLDKKHQRADWSMRPLTPEMLDYAAQDTRRLLELRDRLKEELERAGRWSWAREEFERLEGTRWDPDDASTAWMRIKGARDLSRRELAVFRELAQWRDATAREQDRATFRVATNETLLDIARAQPVTAEALRAVKGVPRGVAERRGEAILGAVRRGLAVADADLPRYPRAARWDKDPDFDARCAALKTVRDRHAAKLEMDPGVLGSRDRLEAVARRNPSSRAEIDEIPELRRWQAALLGDDLVKALTPFRKKKGNGRAEGEGEGEREESPYRE